MKTSCWSQKQGWKDQPITMFTSELCDWTWFFRFCFQLWQSSFHWLINDGVVNGIKGNGNVLILLTPIPPSLWIHLWLPFWFSLGHKCSYDSNYNYNSDSDSVTSENQPLEPVPLRGQKISSHAHKTGSWCFLGVHFKISDEHPYLFLYGSPPRTWTQLWTFVVNSPLTRMSATVGWTAR